MMYDKVEVIQKKKSVIKSYVFGSPIYHSAYNNFIKGVYSRYQKYIKYLGNNNTWILNTRMIPITQAADRSSYTVFWINAFFRHVIRFSENVGFQFFFLKFLQNLGI